MKRIALFTLFILAFAASFAQTIQPNQINTASFRKRVGTVYNITPTSSGAYTKTGSTTTWTFAGGGVTMAGGGSFTDYQIYNSYYTDASNNINQITGTVTSAGTGPGVGLVGASGSFRARINTSTGTLYIETLYGGSVYTRATSAGTITVSASDNLTLTLTRSYLYYYAVCKDNTTGAIVSTSCTDTFNYGAIPFGGFSVSNPMISNDGGTFVITNHNYYLNEWAQPAAVVYGNSIAEGFNSGGLSWPYILGQYSNDGGVVLDAGGSNRTDFYPNLETEIFSLKPKMLIYADGINNIIAGTSLATIESNITTMIQNATAQGIPVVLCTVAPVSSTYGGGSNATYQANIVTLNTWITGRTNCIVSDVWTKLNLAGVLNPIYDCGDGLHGNAAYHRAVAAQLVSDIGQYLRGNSSQVLLGPTYIVSTTNPQLNINYDPSHSTTIGTDASGNTIITPSGGNIENIGNIITNTTGTTGNLYVTQSGQIVADQTLSNWLLPNVSHVQFRVAVGANNTATVLTANDSYFTQEIANTTFSTSAGASTHLYAGSLAVLPPTITSNVGTVTNAPTLFITGQASANATNYYNVLSYAPGAGKNNAWFKYGLTEVSQLKADSIVTLSGAVTLGSTINKLTLTQPATGSTLTLADGKTLTFNNTMTFAGTDAQTYTFPSTSATIARTDAANTFTGHQTIEGVTSTGAIGTGNFMFSISPTTTGTFTAANIIYTGTLVSGASGSTGNIFTAGNGVIVTGQSLANWQVTGAPNMSFRSAYGANVTATTLPINNSEFDEIFANTGVTTSTSAGTHAYIGTALFLPKTITLGSAGVVTNSPTVMISGQAHANATNYYNLLSYDDQAAGTTNAWFKYGVTRVSALKLDSLLTGTIGTDAIVVSHSGVMGTVSATAYVQAPNNAINILASTQTTLVSGTKAVSVTGVGTGSHAYVTLVSQGGTVTTTAFYAAVCTSGTVTVTALTNANTTDTTDTSIVNVFVTN